MGMPNSEILTRVDRESLTYWLELSAGLGYGWMVIYYPLAQWTGQ